MEEKSKKIIIISICIVILLAIVSVVVFGIFNTQKIKLYNETLELGQENYIEELTQQENVYIKEGYTYSVKDNKIDINNVGTYDLTFEIKGQGKTTEETKQIKVVDTTPPTVELKKDTFYIGDNINVEEIVAIKDLSQEGEIAYNEAKVKLEGEFDTSKEGESKATISVTDKNGNTGTQELTIKVKNPIVNLYDYVIEKVSNDGRYTNGSYDNKFVLKFSDNFGNGLSSQGWINFTDKTYYEYTKLKMSYGTTTTAYLSYFNNEYKIEKVYLDSKIYNGDTSSNQNLLNGEIEKVNRILEDKNGKISIAGKTIDQLKNETIDIRELQ